MNKTKSSSELKIKSKGQLLGNYGRLITPFLLMEIISSGILLIASDILNGQAIWNDILYYIIYFLDALLIGVFMMGQAKLYMNFATGRDTLLPDIFYGFRGHQDLGIKIMLVYFAITFCCMIPFGIAVTAFLLTKSIFLYPVMSIALIVGAVIAIRELLALSQCYYIAIDFPDYELKQVTAMSRRIMKGQRAKLFYLFVSFIPMMLLSLLSLGIGLLWFYPYFYCTLTNFYLDLMNYHAKQYA